MGIVNLEKGCEWYFAPGVNFNVGPTDAAGQNFDGSWDSLIRECIQNSLDAVYDTSKPVVVKLLFKKLPMVNYNQFFVLKDHIQACINTFPSAKKQYKPMLEYFTKLSGYSSDKFAYLQISDFNTKGMKYDEKNDSCNFSAFVRGLGVHGGDLDASGRGGSFGLGKSTIYKMSPIRTLFVSTFTEEQNYVFEGVSSLTTHDMDGEKLSHIGYYDNQKGNPITNKDDIPVRFLREKNAETGEVPTGTDIYVMGRNEDKDDVDEIIKAVLTHYWLSIHMNKLVVEIVGAHENVIIDHLSLDNKMCSFFPSLVDNGNKNGINPRTYYNAVVKSDDSSKRKRIEATLPSLGKVELYLEKNIDAKNDRIAFFRLPCMLVMRRSSSQLKLNINNYGVYGVFVCVNSSGDKKLKELENPAHDEWSEKNWRNAVTNKIEPKATEYMEELRSFIAEEIEKFCKKKNAASLKMLGAGKYLYTVQDMVEGDEDTDVVGPSTKGFFEINTIAEHPTGARTAVVNEDVDIKVPENHSGRRSGNVTNMKGKATAVSRDEKPGGVTVLVTPPTKPKNKTQKKNVGGAKPVSANPSDKTAATIVPIEYKVYANKENGRIVHNICISSTENVEDALIKFISKREDGRTDEELEIVDSYCQGTFQGMELHHVRLMAGDNMLKIRFNDNIKHVLYINITLK